MNSSSRLDLDHTRKHSSEVSATALPIRQSPRLLVERGNEAGLLLRSTVMPREAGLWVGRITHDPWPLQGARLTGWRSSMLDAVPGLPGALVDPDAAPLVLSLLTRRERHSLLVGWSARGGRLDGGGGARYRESVSVFLHEKAFLRLVFPFLRGLGGLHN